jgi:integrase
MNYSKTEETLWNLDETVEKLRRISKPTLTIKEVALLLQRDKKTILEWCQKRQIIAEEVPYGTKTTYKIAPQALIMFLESEKTLAEMGKKRMEVKDHSAYIDGWKEAMQAGLIPGYPYSYSETTVTNYTRYMEWFFQEFKTVTSKTFQKVLAKYPNRPEIRRHYYHTIVCFCKYLISQKALDPAVLEHLQENHQQKPNRNPKRPVLSEQELFKIIQVCETTQELAIVLLLASTGIRASECVALKLSDVVLEDRTIIIRQAKWDKSRALGLNDEVTQALANYRRERPNVRCDYFFLTIDQKKMERSGLFARIERLGKMAGVKAAPHMFRRYFATSNLQKGRSIKEVQTALGHSTPDMTLKYDRTSREHVTEAMKNWQIASSSLQ